MGYFMRYFMRSARGWLIYTVSYLKYIWWNPRLVFWKR